MDVECTASWMRAELIQWGIFPKEKGNDREKITEEKAR